MSLTSIICGIALLTIGEVGPQNMPDTIEPVESPFVMPLFERPVFSRIYHIGKDGTGRYVH